MLGTVSLFICLIILPNSFAFSICDHLCVCIHTYLCTLYIKGTIHPITFHEGTDGDKVIDILFL